MQISLRLRLDTSRDSVVVEFDQPPADPADVTNVPFTLEGAAKPGSILVDAQGYVFGVELPGLAQFLDAIAGSPGEKKPAGKPPAQGKPSR